MDESSPAGQVNPASLSASAKSVVAKSIQVGHRRGRSQPVRSTAIRSINCQVADLFGRCFLRVCYWAEILLSFTRGDESVHYTAPPKPANRAPLHPATASISNFIREQAGSALTGSSDGRET
jgi:hypothetical protein